MVHSKRQRDFIFWLHRYIGLFVGLLLVLVGLTGSLLVFEHEIDHFLLRQHFGSIIPQAQRLSPAAIVAMVQSSPVMKPDLKVEAIEIAQKLDVPYVVSLVAADEKWFEVFVHPYTGAILTTREWERSWPGVLLNLHYRLLAGDIGMRIVGIAALLLLILSITGIILWPGWRKLISGFKIKWSAHPKRVNFDLHKVVGIIAALFLAILAFTGFCWNFYEITEPVVHAVTLTAKAVEPTSTPSSGQSLPLEEIMHSADVAMPDAVTTQVRFPLKPDGIFRVRKKHPQDFSYERGLSFILIDQYSGKVLQVRSAVNPSRAEGFLNLFIPFHFGTFGGLSTRILYVFVGLTPLILFTTGFIMRRYCKRNITDGAGRIESETIARF